MFFVPAGPAVSTVDSIAGPIVVRRIEKSASHVPFWTISAPSNSGTPRQARTTAVYN
ncbi:hypothetical protein MCOR15_011834 [Pyricularia oryzae]|nr:hypothetical protein MCOR15_011834 [Pyricularia oryzae]